MAVTAEEGEYARDAERLADHEVDQAFASALRLATLQAQHPDYKGKALVLAQRVKQLERTVQQDQVAVQQLTSKSGSSSTQTPANSDLDVAKAQLGLDSDELADAKRDLARVSGDTSVEIQEELNAHEASMRQYDHEVQSGAQIAVISEKKHTTLAGRLVAWFDQRSRYQLLQQAQQQAQAAVTALTAQHNALESKADANHAVSPDNAKDRATRLADIKTERAEGQILSIYDDRIQTEQQLAAVYGKWSAQVLLQHRIVLHLILQSLTVIVSILIGMLLIDTLVRRLLAHPAIDRRQAQTFRSIFELGTQAVGVVLILFVIFGLPKETPTILGLATAALTIALQDFILGFLGWFVLIGKNGIHVGDWVEINGVGGEVTEVRLFSTTLMETGPLAEKGNPTGRLATFMNGFAISGQYFNFSTSGQWMWDEIAISLPATENIHQMMDRIQSVAVEETRENAARAEQEWRRAARGGGLSRFSTAPMVNLRPSSSGIDLQIRYVTRASERAEARNRLYHRVFEMLQEQKRLAPPEQALETENA
ncbi:MAG: mechanosensitive ion channel family protein [Acidobacteriota bacterium]